MIIRNYEIADYDSICEISSHIWGGNDYLPSMINKYYHDPKSRPIVLEVDGEVISVANTRMISNQIGWLEAMRTHPKARGKGYGRTLTEGQISSAKDMGANEVQLLTNIENIATRKMMERLQFDEIHLYYIWGWSRNDFEEYQDKKNNEIDREGKLISVNHLSKHASEIGLELQDKIYAVKSKSEITTVLEKISQSGFNTKIVGDYLVYDLNSYAIDEWLSKQVIYAINDPASIITIQESKESNNEIRSFSVGVTSVERKVIESALLYTLANFQFDHLELMFSERLEHPLFSIPEFRFRFMRKFL